MFPFVAWHGAEGRTGSGNPNARCPNACCPGVLADCASDPRVTECPQECKFTDDVSGGVSCCSAVPVCSFPLFSSTVQKIPLCISFFPGEDSGFREEVIFLVCTGLLKAFEMSQVCRCEAAHCFNFNFCATPSVLRGNKTYREQS